MQKRHRFKQTHTLEERLTEKARDLRAKAKALPHGIERETLLRGAREAEVTCRLTGWLKPDGTAANQNGRAGQPAAANGGNPSS
jgi:hypothetical protein